MTTLERRGYLDRAAGGSDRIARKLFELQRSVPPEQTLNQLALPHLQRLAASCEETVNLGILDAGEVVVINTVESPQAVRRASKIGNRRHLHATALGKVLLAETPDKEMARLIRLKGLTRLTPNTLVTCAALVAENERVRQQGYALDNQENEMEGRSAGAPIHGLDGRVLAALSISGPVFRMDLTRARSLVPELRRVCAAITRGLRL